MNYAYIQNVVEGVNEENDWEHGGNRKEIVQSLKIRNVFAINIQVMKRIVNFTLFIVKNHFLKSL